MAAKDDTPKKPVKGEIQRNVNDNCRLCGCPLRIKYGEFKNTSYVSSQNLFKVSKLDGLRNGALAEVCSKIALEIERSDAFSDRVCHACARKMRNASELYNFIYSSLQKLKRSKLRSRNLAIQADPSVYCQRPFRRQIEVLKQGKGIKHAGKVHQQRNR